jgi:PAS domain S-box-containing protein
MEKNEQLDHIYKLIMELASGNLQYRAPVSEKNDEIDAITMGINMLAEELQSTTVSKDYLSRIYKGVVDMLIVLNPDNSIQEVNSTVSRLLGYQDDELTGKDFGTLFFRNETRFLDKMNRELTKKGYFQDTERLFKTKRGKSIPVSLSSSLLYDNNGEVNGILYIAKDISKIKKTEEQLRSKNEELNTFIYRASHDLKGPLASILGLVNLAQAEMSDVESIKYYMNLIQLSASRLDSILNDFLELGRLTQSHIKNSTINFEQLINEILRSLEYLPDYQFIDFSFNIKQKKAFKSKKILVKAIIQNLIDNAIKYRKVDAAVRSSIHILIEEVDNEISISVTDNGIGIDRAIQEKIFKMFYRGHDIAGGSGLGLYIVKSSVEALRGRIGVKSKVGQGTTFQIMLPNRN